MAGFTGNSSADILSEFRRIFEQIPNEALTVLYNEWMPRIDPRTERRREYYHRD
jgi:hypothetical protein